MAACHCRGSGPNPAAATMGWTSLELAHVSNRPCAGGPQGVPVYEWAAEPSRPAPPAPRACVACGATAKRAPVRWTCRIAAADWAKGYSIRFPFRHPGRARFCPVRRGGSRGKATASSRPPRRCAVRIEKQGTVSGGKAYASSMAALRRHRGSVSGGKAFASSMAASFRHQGSVSGGKASLPPWPPCYPRQAKG